MAPQGVQYIVIRATSSKGHDPCGTISPFDLNFVLKLARLNYVLHLPL